MRGAAPAEDGERNSSRHELDGHAIRQRGGSQPRDLSIGRDDLAPDRKLAYTTVGTMLSKMEAGKHVAHRSDGRVNIYRPLLRKDQVSQSMVSDLAERLFQGDVTELMCSLLDGRDVTPDELTRLKKLIRDKERELRDDE